MKTAPRTIVAAAGAALALIFAVGCSGSGGTGAKSPGAAASSSTAEAVTILRQATDAMRKVTGMHVSLAVSGNVPNLRVTKLDGDVSNTPATAASGSATLLVGRSNEDATFVFVDGHLYSDLGQRGKFTDFGNGKSIYNVPVMLDPDKGLANILAKLQGASVDGTEQVNGVATTKITGNSTADDIALLAGAKVTDQGVATVPTTVWISSDGSSHLVQLRINPTKDTSVTMTMSDWGKTVTPTKPPTA